MVAGEIGDADDEEDNEEDSGPEARESEPVGSSTGSDDDDDSDIIEVPARDFYEGNEADPGFLGSLFTFPLNGDPNGDPKVRRTQPDPTGQAGPYGTQAVQPRE